MASQVDPILHCGDSELPLIDPVWEKVGCGRNR